MIIGTDVSFYQDDPNTPAGIDFAKMREAGAHYTIIRAGQRTWVDNEFAISWRNAKGILPRGSYFFYDSREDPKRQAQLWVNTLAGDLGELPLWADFEDNYGGAWSGWRYWYDFLEEVKRLTPNKEIGIYTGYYYWIEQTTSKGIPSASLEYFKQLPLWIANYGATTPLIPKPWTVWTFWQFTDKGDGKKYGVESLNIDLNYFNGDENKFAERFNLGEIPPPQENKMYQATVINSGTRLRKDHSTFAEVVTSFAANTRLSGTQLWVAPADGNEVKAGDKWIYVTHANGGAVAVQGWTAVIHKGIAYCRDLVEPSDPPTEPVPAEFSVTVKATGYKSVTVDLEPE